MNERERERERERENRCCQYLICWFAISWIQFMGNTSAGCGASSTDLVGCVSSLDIPRASGFCPPVFNTPEGNADRHRGIFGVAGRVWATVLRPNPPYKRPYATLVRLVGRRTNTVVSTSWWRWVEVFRNVSDIPPSQNSEQGYFIVGTTHKSRFMRGWSKKYLVLSAFSFGRRFRRQPTQPCKADKTWEDASLRLSVEDN